MDYTAQLAKEHSRTNSDRIARAVGNDPKEFKKIIDIIYNGTPPLPQRAAWLLSIINKQQPELLKPYINKFINDIESFKVDALRRNMAVVLASHSIPKASQGKLIDTCYRFILSPDEVVAVKVHAMQIIANLTKEHPELKEELKAVIRDQLDKNTAAFAARAKAVMKQIKD